jgi:hypothetical protein
MKALLNTLTEAEPALVRECERDSIAAADEDTLVQLHGRVRRARNKYVGLYRKQATLASPNTEIFEDALARVSRQLAIAAPNTSPPDLR